MNRARPIFLDHTSEQPAIRSDRASWYTPGLSDGLGDRLLMFDNTSASALELLRFKPEFSGTHGFEDSLRSRLERFSALIHPSVAKVRAVEWLGDGEGLALVSNFTPGRRIGEIFYEGRSPSFALELIRQVTPVLAVLHQQGRGATHGVLTADRIVVTPEGRLVLVEHVLGSAVESLGLSAKRLRSEIGIAVPNTRGAIAFDGRADILQLGFIALSLLLGRRIDPIEYPDRATHLLDEFCWVVGPRGEAAAGRLRAWLERALQLDGRGFESARAAEAALNDLPEQLAEPQGAIFAFNRLPRQIAMKSAPESIASVPRVEPILQLEPPRRRTAMWWLAAAIAVLALGEAGVIAGLLRTRSAFTAAAAQTPPVTRGDAKAPDNHVGPVGPVNPVRAEVLPPAPPAPSPAPAPVPPQATTPPPASAPTSGLLEITSDPSGAKVTVDGTARGTTPVTVPVAPGQHDVVISDGTRATTRTVNAVAGNTTTLVASFAPAVAAAGWVTIKVPIELQVREGGSLIGVTTADRLMLPAGRHDLELSNAAVGFQTKLAVDIQPGKTVTSTVTLPMGSVSINALPWANVSIDGQALTGTTPFANIEVPLGTHEIVWKHPQLGERRQTVVVTVKAPLRLQMDLNK
jgi:PEGA domain-containing protein